LLCGQGHGEQSTGCASLRRDGFASLRATGGGGGSFTTKQLILGSGRYLDDVNGSVHG
jgi:hypothetical protein